MELAKTYRNTGNTHMKSRPKALRITTVFSVALTILASSPALAGLQKWGSFTNLLEETGLKPETEWITYTSNNSISSPVKCTGVLYWNVPNFEPLPIGGFDIQNGTVTKSYFIKAFFDDPAVYVPYNANTRNGTPGFSWEIYYDFDGDGWYGDAIIDYGFVPTIVDRTEQLLPSEGAVFHIRNFTTYGTANPGSFTFTADPILKFTSLSVTGNVAEINVVIGFTGGNPIALESSPAPTGMWQSVTTLTSETNRTTISCTATSTAAFFRLRLGN